MSINANGFSWLQTVAVGHKVEFVPLFKRHDTAECQVILLDPSYEKSRLDLAEALLSLGFAKISDIPRNVHDKEMINYYKYLQIIETKAKKRRTGMWSNR